MSTERKPSPEVLKLVEEVKALPLPDKLRLAAMLIEKGRLREAESLLSRCSNDLYLIRRGGP